MIHEAAQFRVGKFEILGLDPSLAQALIDDSGLKPGSVFNAQQVKAFFERNKSLLPLDARPEENTEEILRERESIIDLTMDFRGCAGTQSTPLARSETEQGLMCSKDVPQHCLSN